MSNRTREFGVLALLAILAVSSAACVGVAGTVDGPEAVPVEVAPSAVASLPTEVPPTAAPLTGAPAEPLAAVSFGADVRPILESSCATCHGADAPKAGASLVDYAGVMAGAASGPIVVPGDAEGSLLVQVVAEGRMPPKEPKLSEGQIQIIRDWVNAGAQDN